MASISFAKIIARCEQLRINLEPLLTEFPHLASEHAELVAFLEEAKALQSKQDAMRAEKQQTTRLRKEIEAKCRDLFSRVAVQLRGKLGFKNEQLLKFGIPHRRPVRRAKSEGPAPPTTTGTTTPAPQSLGDDGQPSEVTAATAAETSQQ